MPPPSKHPKRSKKAAAAAQEAEAKKPETFDEAVDEALALEDKGDRYASGAKALRFYQRAREMYAHAHSLNPEDPEALYNWGRLILVLAEFTDPAFEPEEKYALFKEAADRLRSGDRENADCLFNLAQALRGLAEVVLEEDGIGGGAAEAVSALTEAEAVLETVYRLQEASTVEIETPPEGMKPAEEEEEGPSDSRITTLIETLSAHAQTLTILFKEVAEPAASILYDRSWKKLDQAQAVLDQALIADNFTEKQKLQLQIDIHIRYAEVLAARADVISQVQHRVDAETFERAVHKLTLALAADEKNVEALCEKGDVLCSWADAIKTANGGLDKVLSSDSGNYSSASGSSSSSSPAAQQPASPLASLRSLYARAVESYTKAFTFTPTSATLSRTCGNIHLLRIPLHSGPTEQTVLAENAEKYYRRAVQLGDHSVLMALAKATSWSSKEADCKKVLTAWRKQVDKGDVDEDGDADDDTAEVGFAPIVADWKWIDAILSGGA